MSAHADPQGARQPALPALDQRGLLESVADRSSQVISDVRDRAAGLVDSAMNFLGVRYRRGGYSAETGFDCSGFTRYVFEHSIGKVLPHRADEQANDPGLVKVEQKDLKPGDLVFFDTVRRTFSHVGIYLGGGKFIHSPRPGEAVRVEDMNISYWARHFTGARRVPELAANGGPASESNASMVAKFAELSGYPAPPAGATLAPAAHPPTNTAETASALVLPVTKTGTALPSLADRALGLSPLHAPVGQPIER